MGNTKWQSRETSNTWHKRRGQTRQPHNIIWHHYTQTNLYIT